MTVIDTFCQTSQKYVAFCDILGFSQKIMKDFDVALKMYENFCNYIAENGVTKDVDITIYSDAILVTSDTLESVATAVQILWFLALRNNFMLRGGISHGRYWEKRSGNHFFVVSDALIRAVNLEKSVGVPAIVIADDIKISDEKWLYRFQHKIPTHMPILHFRDRNIINPFSPYWCRSAGNRARMLLEQNQTHKDKYLWFISLHEAVWSAHPLVPPDVLQRLKQKYEIDIKSLATII